MHLKLSLYPIQRRAAMLMHKVSDHLHLRRRRPEDVRLDGGRISSGGGGGRADMHLWRLILHIHGIYHKVARWKTSRVMSFNVKWYVRITCVTLCGRLRLSLECKNWTFAIICCSNHLELYFPIHFSVAVALLRRRRWWLGKGWAVVVADVSH